ncbi:MAG TPA: cytochrome c [Thermoanaerobaculia bacterium]|nr:cytochrome c [Thermoanaerobaculia bacterium]
MTPEGKRKWATILRIALVAGLVLVVGFGLYLAWRLTLDRPVDYKADADHFKHGSLGGERTMGIPYWLWVALPELFPEYLPDQQPGRGYASFGMLYEPGEDPRYALPIGVSRRNVRGIESVYLNCAVCHTSTVRKAPDAPPRVILGMPANTFDTGAWAQFLGRIARDQKFTPERLLDQIRALQDNPHRVVDKPDLINRLIFRYVAVYLMREQMLALPQRLSFIDLGSWGPGRNDTFGADKAFFRFPMAHADPSEATGNADFPSIWNQGPRQGQDGKWAMGLHWDGNNDRVGERNLNAAYAAGVIPPTADAARMERTAKWLETAKPVPITDFFPVDAALAARGEPIYAHYCASCHGTKDPPFRHLPPLPAEYVGEVTPIGVIGTDRHRLDSFTRELSVNLATNYAGFEKDWGFDPPYPQRFTRYHKTWGYANAPLDGAWLRAPYLHNGSVPNLRELLLPAAARTKVFYRGDDVYDPANVGFVANLPEREGHRFFRFDTARPGNGNGGHEGEAFGTYLSAEQKNALLEYLKTF